MQEEARITARWDILNESLERKWRAGVNRHQISNEDDEERVFYEKMEKDSDTKQKLSEGYIRIRNKCIELYLGLTSNDLGRRAVISQGGAISA